VTDAGAEREPPAPDSPPPAADPDPERPNLEDWPRTAASDDRPAYDVRPSPNRNLWIVVGFALVVGIVALVLALWLYALGAPLP
jgi:hypothetical protein